MALGRPVRPERLGETGIHLLKVRHGRANRAGRHLNLLDELHRTQAAFDGLVRPVGDQRLRLTQRGNSSAHLVKVFGLEPGLRPGRTVEVGSEYLLGLLRRIAYPGGQQAIT